MVRPRSAVSAVEGESNHPQVLIAASVQAGWNRCSKGKYCWAGCFEGNIKRLVRAGGLSCVGLLQVPGCGRDYSFGPTYL